MRPLILSLCGVVCEHLLYCHVVITAKWVVSCTRITCIQPLSRPLLADITCLNFLFRKCCCFLSLFPFFFTMHSFIFYIWLIGHFVPAWQLAWLGQPFCISLVVCICLHPDALSSVVLISVLLYQSTAFVFLDGSWVSEGLVRVSLAFHLFVIGTVIFVLCSYDCSRPLLCCRQ